jgi:hypothetical protein
MMGHESSTRIFTLSLRPPVLLKYFHQAGIGT